MVQFQTRQGQGRRGSVCSPEPGLAGIAQVLEQVPHVVQILEAAS